MRVYLLTLGCPKNQVDSEALQRRLMAQGISFTDTPDSADVLLVNTCGFIEDAKKESIDEILSLAKHKNGTGRRLVVFGCLAQRYRDELIQEVPEIDAVFGVGMAEEMAMYFTGLSGSQTNVTDAASGPHAGPLVETPHSYLKISDGCNRKCTFCVIPSIRGRLRSIHPDEVMREAEAKVGAGARELILVAQDITGYSHGGYRLSDLIKDLDALPGDFWIRLLYLYPTSVDSSLMEAVAGAKKVVKYLDMPLQHSEDRMLRLMGRRGSRKEYLRLAGLLRREIPGVALRTSFIVGFPGETEEDFRGLMQFISEAAFDNVGAFKYSKEEGTKAASLSPQVPSRVKDRRYRELMELQAEISLARNEELVGRRMRALVEDEGPGFSVSRIYRQAPEIDGVTVIEASGLNVGDFVDIEITGAGIYDLKARPAV